MDFHKDIDNDNKKHNILSIQLNRPPTCGLIIIDNFYTNALEAREQILKQAFSVTGNFPGKRTKSYATNEIKDFFQKYVEPFGGKITDFVCPNMENLQSMDNNYNGSFQYTTSRDRSWIHSDKHNNWAGVLYFTPDAPLSSGTAFYRFKDGSYSQKDTDILKNQDEINRYSQDLTKWELVDRVGNVFNRLILFNSNRYHMSMDYFGDTIETGRLFQVFFFSTERN